MDRPLRILAVALVLGFAHIAASRADTVLETLRNSGNFSIFLAAAKTAGMTDVLATKNPITVFAPTDDAFTKLPPSSVTVLDKPEGKDAAKALVGNHIVAGVVMSRDVTGKHLEATTIAGTTLEIDATRGFMIAGAKVTKADIAADNGLVHVVDTVLTPEESER
jgi:uncharacterized surface protein with fasciclin (FAS1) repeats